MKRSQPANIVGHCHGIPYGVKDLCATKGHPTTWGALPYKNQQFDFDATVVQRLRSAGAVLVAKLAMVELAGAFGYDNADASFTGPGRNPWQVDYWSGGSSSGPGSAVAAGLVAFAIGSETSGSIITPAAYCGVTGLRPTFGRVSRHGTMALSWSLDKLGPMCRNAEDCGLILAAIAGRDVDDPSTAARKFAFAKPEPLGQEGRGKVKLGIIKGCLEHAQPEVRKNFEESVRVLRRFAHVDDDVALPDFPYSAIVATIIQAEAASAFSDLLDSGRCRELQAKNDRWGGYAGAAVLAVDYLQALRVRGFANRALANLHARYDALLAPSRQTVALPIDTDFDKAYPGKSGGPEVIQAGNCAGLPAISVPNGFGEKGLPTGIQFTGRAWSEARLLAIAHAYQEATAWHTKRPPALDK